jgi:hypothetical protein
MLFDLQGPRKTFVKVIYLGLAILMGGGLILFGIGSDVNGGLANVFGTSTTADTARDNVKKYAEQLQKNPDSEETLQNLIAARYSLAGDEENFNQKTGKFTKEGEQQLKLLTDNWDTYIKVTKNEPSIGTANYAVSAFLGLNDAKGATAAQQILVKDQPTASNYLALMLYASYAGNTLVASGAEARAKEVATEDEKQQVKDQIKEIKDQIADRSQEVQQQIQEQFKQQAQQSQGGSVPSNPFSGAGGGGLTTGGSGK